MKDITSDLAEAILSPSPLAATQAVWDKANSKSEQLKLDLGAGIISPDGFTPRGNINRTAIYPLPFEDASVDVIRCSHALEHFSFSQIADVLTEWVRVLKPGGRLKIAVPDFDKIAEAHVNGETQNVQGYLMGGQIDEADFHKTVWNRDELRRRLAATGLVLLREWESELEDCASLPISLNIEGTKPLRSEIKVSAAMSVPRLGFMDNFGCCIDALVPLNIRLKRQGGAFWGQALTNCLEVILDQDAPDAVLTLDYDTVFSAGHVAHLMQLMLAYPEAHAIAALQSSRHLPTALFTKRDDDDVPMSRVPLDEMAGDLMKVSSAHFGLTLIRADKLREMPKPWFHSKPSSDGQWHYGDDHVDEDINFWESWRAAGNNLFLANRVAVGHIEVMARWPGRDLQAIYQPMGEWNKTGKAPEECWK